MRLSIDELVQHLREDVTPARDDGRATLDRIQRSLGRMQKSRVRQTRVLTFAAAACLTTIAFAHYTGHLPELGHTSPERAPVLQWSQADRGAVVVRVAPFFTTANSRGEAAAPTTPQPTTPQPTTPQPTTPQPGPAAKPAELAVPAPSAPVPVNEAEAGDPALLSALYAEAHRLQFTAPPARALAAWDRYLAAHPRGPLAIEARYNRAISLLRLGRKEDAREALSPFADGDFGAFRQRDAQRWIRSLDAPTSR